MFSCRISNLDLVGVVGLSAVPASEPCGIVTSLLSLVLSLLTVELEVSFSSISVISVGSQSISLRQLLYRE